MVNLSAADVRSVQELLGFIQQGGQPKYLLFWGHKPPVAGGVGKGCLSQWWPAAFTVGGVAYPSAEHYMMSAKAMLFGDTEMAGRIQMAPHPGAPDPGRGVSAGPHLGHRADGRR